MRLAIQELKLIVKDLNFSAEDIDDMFKKLDLDNTGLITLSQFLIATLSPDILDDDKLLQ